MTYSIFKKIILARIMDYLPLKYQNHILGIQENGNIENLYLIEENHKGIIPTVSLNDLYNNYLEIHDMNILLTGLADILVKINQSEVINIRFNKEYVKENVRIRLQQNRVDETSIPFLDMFLVYYIPIDDNGCLMNMVLTKEQISNFEITIEEIKEWAKNNTKKDVWLCTMHEMDEDKEKAEEWEKDIYFLSNQPIFNGSVLMIYREILDEIEEKYGSGLYISTISVDECLIAPKSKFSLNEFEELSKSIREEFQEDEEPLTDSIYSYEKGNYMILKQERP